MLSSHKSDKLLCSSYYEVMFCFLMLICSIIQGFLLATGKVSTGRKKFLVF